MRFKVFCAVFIILYLVSCSTTNDKHTTVNGKNQSISLVFVEGGMFNMGNSVYKVRTEVSSFYIGKTDVTQKQWQEIEGIESDFATSSLPITGVSWLNAVEFCNKLSISEGLEPAYIINGTDVIWNHFSKGYRLPTEAEWEFAARGGVKSKGFIYPGSNDLDEVTWCFSNSNGQLHNVAQKKPNELGLYDMVGLCYNWVWDWLDNSDLYAGGKNPKGPVTGQYKILRGTSWQDSPVDASLEHRNFAEMPGFRRICGFRIAKSL